MALLKTQSNTSFETIVANIKAKSFLPLYCFCGEETYFVDVLTNLIEHNALNDMEKAFNQTIVYGKDVNVRTIVETALRLPIMADRQVVIVKEAQGLEIRKEEDQTKLLNYFKNPAASTILVFAFKNASPDKRKSVWKELAKSNGFFESKALYENQVAPFIRKFATERKLNIEEPAIELLIESTGTNLSKVINELSKVVLNKTEGSTITTKDIETEVGISKEFSLFELNNALAKKNVELAFKIAYFLAKSKNNPFVVTVANLYSFFSKIYLAHAQPNADDKTLAALLKVNPYFVKDYKEAVRNYPLGQVETILKLLNEYDLRSKGVGGTANITEGELLRELVYRIIIEKKTELAVEFSE